jgi:hypothetical protein
MEYTGTRPTRAELAARKVLGAMKTMKQIAEERRQVKLALLHEQVQNGSLVIRRMTDEERDLYPARRRGRRRAA